MKTFFTQDELKEALRVLHDSKRTFECSAARVDTDGKETFGIDTNKQVTYGTHGSAFAQINPETLELRCGACAGDLNATVKPKVVVQDKRRQDHFHLVSQD